MVMVIERPYAACMADDLRKSRTMPMHATHKKIFIYGTYNWPFISVGYLMVIFGQKFSEMASLMTVKEPLIRAWLAIIAALIDFVFNLQKKIA